MVDDDPLFPLVRKGYDRAPVDERIHTLESALEQTRSQVAGLDARILRLSGELAQAQKEARENERPSYGGLGSRVERLLRSTEQQALDVVTRANAEAQRTVDQAQRKAEELVSLAESEAGQMTDRARNSAEQLRRICRNVSVCWPGCPPSWASS